MANVAMAPLHLRINERYMDIERMSYIPMIPESTVRMCPSKNAYMLTMGMVPEDIWAVGG